MRFLSLFFLIFALACRAPAIYVAPVIIYPLENVAGTTACGWNNLPLIYLDTAVVQTTNIEFIYTHEQKHARDMKAYKGGCWAFFNRYRSDKAFRVKSELAAYCLEGQLAISRNKNAAFVWQRIKDAVSADTVLTEKDNCIYKEW